MLHGVAIHEGEGTVVRKLREALDGNEEARDIY